MIDEHMFYSRTDVCQRSFFFVGRTRPFDPDVQGL